MPVPSTPAERRAHLRGVPLLGPVDDASLDALLACLGWRTLAPGAVLFREGDPGDTLVFVTAGTLSVRVRHVDGSDVEVGRPGVGETLGEMACIDPAARSATVTALDEAVVAELSRDGLTALQHAMPALSARVTGEVIRVVTRRLRELEGRIDQELGGGPSASSRPGSEHPGDGHAAPRRAGILGLLDRLRGGA